MKYTRKDVIVWPDDKRLKGAIRKKAYFGENPNDVLNDANENRYAMKLYKIEKSSDHPFMSAETAGWHFLILKKGAEKKIAPFDFSLKEDRDAVKDKWLIDKATGTETKVLNFIKSSKGFWTVELFINREWISIVPAGLLEYYVFADTGKPVGKEVEA